MIPRNQRNSKMQVNLSCPTCGMSLEDRKTDGFVSGTETYCCEGCANGTGCTCRDIRVPKLKAGNRKVGFRNADT
jgi:hypothetical protein